MFLKVVVIMFP